MRVTDSRTPGADASLSAIAAEEARLEERLAQARAEAERIRFEAIADVECRRKALSERLAELERSLAARAAAGRERRCEQIERDAERRCAVFAAVSETRVRALADAVAQRLVDSLPIG